MKKSKAKPFIRGATIACAASMMSGASLAGAELSAGFWWVYQNEMTSGSSDADGEFADPALIVYASDDGSHGRWGFSGEMRIGTGSFTDPDNNNSGDNFTVHKAWISYQLDENNKLILGKSQVPFGWKTSNFWPGDLLQGGYGDQMDVGLKLTGKNRGVQYDVAYYSQDDWGKTSTDTVDDNRHWGSKTTYRKGETLVLNANMPLGDGHTIGASYQHGKMEDLTNAGSGGRISDDGKHRAVDLHYIYSKDNFTFKYRFIDVTRDFTEMDACIAATNCADVEVENQRHAVHFNYTKDQWSFYLEATSASTDTEGNTADDVIAFAPGVSYDYGPGWLYAEYLSQDGFIGRDGDVGEGDFDALYLSFDFYFD